MLVIVAVNFILDNLYPFCSVRMRRICGRYISPVNLLACSVMRMLRSQCTANRWLK